MIGNLAIGNGQVAATAGTIASLSNAAQSERINVTFSNTGGSSETLVVTVVNNGGTARRILRAVLATNEQVVISGLVLDGLDVLKAVTTNASAVDYTVAKASDSAEFSVVTYDANGAIKTAQSGAAGDLTIAGVLTVGSDVVLNNGSGTDNTVWDASTVSALWANAPSKLEPDYHAKVHEFWDDFDRPASATASDAEAYTDGNDGGTGTNAFQDAAGGVYNVVTAAADNDYHAMSSVLERFKFEAGKKLWFEARFKLSEATTNESAWWFGLTDTLTTGGFQADTSGPLASYDGALIWKDEASMAIDFETSNAATQATTTDMATFVSNTWTRVGFYFDGTATTSVVTPYYDVGGGTLVAGTAQNITLSGLEEMHLVFGVKAGPTAGAETLQVDYVRCVQLR